MSSGSGPWKGDEETDKTGGQAEAVADRVARHGPVTGDRSGEGDQPDGTAGGHRTGKKANARESGEVQEEKRRAAIEQHDGDRVVGTGTAPKNI
jgi:hypothetical protein